MAHNNSIELSWAEFKRGYHGTSHYVRPKHLDGYLREYAKYLPYNKLVA